MIRKFVPAAMAVVAALAMTSSGPAQEAVKITLADQNSPQGWGPMHALQPWVKQVEEAGKGRIKMEVFPSQTLIKGIDMWRGVRTGIADIGWCVQGYWPEQTPLSDVMSLPFLPIKSAEQGASVLWRIYEKFPQIQKEYGDIQPLVLYTTSPNFLITSKKQVKTLDDMKGLKIRTLGGPPIEMARALGASPAVMPMPDLYQALDKGVFDGAAVPWEAIHAFRLYEVAKNVTIVPFYASYFSLCANRQKIQSLPKDVRDALLSKGGLEGSKFWGKNFFDTAQQGVEERVKASGITLNRYDLPAAEVERWKKIAGEPLWDQWVKKMEGKGHKEARQVLDTVLEMLKN